MVSKHRKHLMDIERRKKLKEQQANHPTNANNQKDTVMHNQIERTKVFVKRHKKAFIIGGTLLATAALAVIAHKMLKTARINGTVKELATIGFQPASAKAVKKEMKLEMKGAAKRNLQRAAYTKFSNTNRYAITEDGIMTNLKTRRVLKPVLDTAGDAWLIQFVEDNQFKIDPVQRLVELYAPTFAANTVEVITEATS